MQEDALNKADSAKLDESQTHSSSNSSIPSPPHSFRGTKIAHFYRSLSFHSAQFVNFTYSLGDTKVSPLSLTSTFHSSLLPSLLLPCAPIQDPI